MIEQYWPDLRNPRIDGALSEQTLSEEEAYAYAQARLKFADQGYNVSEFAPGNLDHAIYEHFVIEYFSVGVTRRARGQVDPTQFFYFRTVETRAQTLSAYLQEGLLFNGVIAEEVPSGIVSPGRLKAKLVGYGAGAAFPRIPEGDIEQIATRSAAVVVALGCNLGYDDATNSFRSLTQEQERILLQVVEAWTLPTLVRGRSQGVRAGVLAAYDLDLAGLHMLRDFASGAFDRAFNL